MNSPVVRLCESSRSVAHPTNASGNTPITAINEREANVLFMRRTKRAVCQRYPLNGTSLNDARDVQRAGGGPCKTTAPRLWNARSDRVRSCECVHREELAGCLVQSDCQKYFPNQWVRPSPSG